MAQESHDFKIQDRFYGKECIRIAEVVRNGAFHTIKQYEMELKMSLAGVKEYLSADNSEIICADGCKDTIYILANNHGIKSPEEFGILACHHFLSQYPNMTNVCLTIEDLSWNRISYKDDNDDDDVKTIEDSDGSARTKLHNHAFIHTSGCVRTCSVTLNREDMAPHVVSGIKNLRLAKTSQATFAGMHRDEYSTLPDIYEKVLSTNVNCTWSYKDDVTVIDYDNVWNVAKKCIIKSWGGDTVEGVLSTCIQFSIASAERNLLKAIPEIKSIEMLMPNLLYADFDFTRFPALKLERVNRKIYVPVTQPAGIVFAKMVRNGDQPAKHVN